MRRTTTEWNYSGVILRVRRGDRAQSVYVGFASPEGRTADVTLDAHIAEDLANEMLRVAGELRLERMTEQVAAK